MHSLQLQEAFGKNNGTIKSKDRQTGENLTILQMKMKMDLQLSIY